MGKYNKKGFTLIELLAVIAILSILVVIAVPKVLQLFSDAKKRTFEIEVQNIIKSAELGYTKSVLKGNASNTTYTYVDGVESKSGNITLNISGRKVQDGEINITSLGEIGLAIYDGTYCAIKELSSENILIEERSLEECVSIASPELTPRECFITDLSLTHEVIQYYYDTAEFMPQEELDEYGIIPISEILSNEIRIYSYDYLNPNCPSDVVIPNQIDGKSVVSIGVGAFLNIDANEGMGITSIQLPSTLKYIEYYSLSNNQITSLTLPNSLIMIGMVTFMDNQITSLTIPSNVNSIGMHAFTNNQISNLTINNGITYIAPDVFSDNQLTTLILPDSLTRIEDDTFAYNQLTDVTLPSNLTFLSGFSNNLLESIDIPNTVVTIGEDAFEENLFSSIEIPEGVTSIGFNAFEYNQLTSVTLPSSLITIGIQAFAYNLLENITIPNNVTTIETNAFRFNDLVGIELPNSVTFIGPRAFEYNNILQDDATIDNNSINVTIDVDAFSHNGIDGNTTITPIFLRD